MSCANPRSCMQAEAAQLSVPNEYGALLQRQGAVGLNAATSQDSTKYYVSLLVTHSPMSLEMGSVRALGLLVPCDRAGLGVLQLRLVQCAGRL